MMRVFIISYFKILICIIMFEKLISIKKSMKNDFKNIQINKLNKNHSINTV